MPNSISLNAVTPEIGPHSAVRASLRAHSPEMAAMQLAEALGGAKALSAAANELRAARRARSRSHYQFWAIVHERIAQAAREVMS